MYANNLNLFSKLESKFRKISEYYGPSFQMNFKKFVNTFANYFKF